MPIRVCIKKSDTGIGNLLSWCSDYLGIIQFYVGNHKTLYLVSLLTYQILRGEGHPPRIILVLQLGSIITLLPTIHNLPRYNYIQLMNYTSRALVRVTRLSSITNPTHGRIPSIGKDSLARYNKAFSSTTRVSRFNYELSPRKQNSISKDVLTTKGRARMSTVSNINMNSSPGRHPLFYLSRYLPHPRTMKPHYFPTGQLVSYGYLASYIIKGEFGFSPLPLRYY